MGTKQNVITNNSLQIAHVSTLNDELNSKLNSSANIPISQVSGLQSIIDNTLSSHYSKIETDNLLDDKTKQHHRKQLKFEYGKGFN
jgi:hypothetical protein